jgi:hypothetical protein
MREYRFYLLDEHGKIFGPPSHGKFEDDAAASLHARELSDSFMLEVWTGARLVERVPPKNPF